jgi:hypothetical protein
LFTFQSIMFVSLGFLCALLLGFVVAPAFWARAVRLTTERMRASLPLTEMEISAERDRLRAENAIRVHQLSARLEQARLSQARQKVEINRRDATVSSLQRRLQAIETEREGSENARRVLEATITQRIPEVEGRLVEARQLLAKRDAEMTTMQGDTGRTYRALDEAMQVNAQQRAEIDRLKMTVVGHGGRTQSAGAETETALRAELGVLQARSRDQAALIVRLQSDAAAQAAGGTANDARANGSSADESRGKSQAIPFKSVSDGAPEAERNAMPRHAEVEGLKAKLAAQDGQLETLTAQLRAYEGAAQSESRSLSLRDTKAALKSRIAAAEKEIASRDSALLGLRKELALANERVARQASYYMEEFRRLGGGGAHALQEKALCAATQPPGAEAKKNAAAEARRDTSERGAHLPPNEEAARVKHDDKATAPRAKAADAKEKKLSKRNAATEDKKAKQPQSLEDRLAASDDQPVYDFDQHFDGASNEANEPEPKDKLMDRIAALAKR